MVGLYRFKCADCGSEVIQDKSSICDSCGSIVTFDMQKPSLSHDKQIMNRLEHVFCPNCSRSRGVKHMHGRNDWRCTLCGEAYLCDSGGIPFPEKFSKEQQVRFQAWCRYQRQKNGEYFY